jgi:hypothetical protein
MDADTALIRAFDLGMDDAGWTEEVMDEAESLLPTLVAAGYAAREDESDPRPATPTSPTRTHAREAASTSSYPGKPWPES